MVSLKILNLSYLLRLSIHILSLERFFLRGGGLGGGKRRQSMVNTYENDLKHITIPYSDDSDRTLI